MKKALAIATCLMVAPVLPASEIISIPNTPVNQKLMDTIGLDYDCMGSTETHLHFHHDEEAKALIKQFGQFKQELFKDSSTVNSDVQAQFLSVETQNDLGIYHTHAEVVAELQKAAADYPDLTELRVIGQTFEGRDVHALILSDKNSEQDKVSFLVTGTHHAREWISTEVPLGSIQDLLTSYGDNEEATEILKTSTIVFVPMLNVDGAIHSRTKSKMWRKNRNTNKAWGGQGVDNNRNYSYKWGGPGASGWKGSQTYRGPEAMSEVENQMVGQLQQEFNFTTAISFHSYSELVLWPWGYTNKMQCKDHAIFEKFGKEMGKIMGNYKPMQASHLYPASGVFDDYLYGDFGVLTYTIELGRQFVPAESEVPTIVANGSKMLRYVFTQTRDPFAGASERENYQIATQLEQVVRNLDNVQGESRIQQAIDALGQYDLNSIEETMAELKTSPMTRLQILRLLKQRDQFSDQNQ